MRFLKNFSKWDLYLDIDSGNRFINKSNLFTIGFFEEINDSLSTLFIENNRLYFSFKGELFFIEDSVYVTLLNIRQESENLLRKEFCLYLKSGMFKTLTLVRFQYLTEIGYNIAPFDYIDDEDFDWGLFLQNIINNQKRKNDFISSRS